MTHLLGESYTASSTSTLHSLLAILSSEMTVWSAGRKGALAIAAPAGGVGTRCSITLLDLKPDTVSLMLENLPHDVIQCIYIHIKPVIAFIDYYLFYFMTVKLSFSCSVSSVDRQTLEAAEWPIYLKCCSLDGCWWEKLSDRPSSSLTAGLDGDGDSSEGVDTDAVN